MEVRFHLHGVEHVGCMQPQAQSVSNVCVQRAEESVGSSGLVELKLGKQAGNAGLWERSEGVTVMVIVGMTKVSPW